MVVIQVLSDPLVGKYVLTQNNALLVLYISRYIGNRVTIPVEVNKKKVDLLMCPNGYLLYKYSDVVPYSPVVSEKEIISRKLIILGFYDKDNLTKLQKMGKLMKMN